MNIYRILGDLCLISSTPIFAYKALKYGSEDISLITQSLRLVMFCTRYLDVFTVLVSLYNTFMKGFLVISTLMLVLILARQKLKRHGFRGLGPAIGLMTMTVIAPFFVATLVNYQFTLGEILWSFSRFLNAGVETHQLAMVYQMEKLDFWIMAYYLSVTGHVVFYMGNWVYRYLTTGMSDPIAVFSALVEIVVIAAYFIARHIVRGKTGFEQCTIYDADFKNTQASKLCVIDQEVPFIIIEEVA